MYVVNHNPRKLVATYTVHSNTANLPAESLTECTFLGQIMSCQCQEVSSKNSDQSLQVSVGWFFVTKVRLQMNGAVSKVNKKFISHLTRAKRIPSAAATV